jgi:hypothetical protein
MAGGSPNMKCFKKKFQKIKIKIKIKYIFVFFWKIFKVGGAPAIASIPRLWLGAR